MTFTCALSATACYQSGVKADVKKLLFDKEAARWGVIHRATFIDAETGEELKGACGHVNSKNRYGAYTGPTAFLHVIKSNTKKVTMFYDGTDDASFRIIWRESCHGMTI